MLSRLAPLLPAVSLLMMTSATARAAENAPPPLPEGYKLVWSEEFDKPGLPDPAKWGYEVGFVRNKEEQYYTEARKENVEVKDGSLVITGIKEEYPNPKGKADSKNWQHAEKANYTSGSIHTKGKASWTYGRIEVRAKLPEGRKGMWPAIWTLGDNISDVGWPKCGEIDIMEFVGKEPEKVHGTVHWHNPKRDNPKKPNDKHDSMGNKILTDKPWEDYHVYTADWTPEKIDIYFDGQMYHSFPITGNDKLPEGDANPFHKPHYLILNLALGGGWGGPIDDTALPQEFKVDYVRVYQKP